MTKIPPHYHSDEEVAGMFAGLLSRLSREQGKDLIHICECAAEILKIQRDDAPREPRPV